MTDRCDCPYPDPVTYGGPNPHCSEHGDPDAILASGEYRDRKGREWSLWHDLTGGPSEWMMWGDHRFEHPLTPGPMRLLIVRDLHRDECPGLAKCELHPFPMIWRAAKGRWWHGTGWAVNEYPTFAEAIAAAQRMTGE